MTVFPKTDNIAIQARQCQKVHHISKEVDLGRWRQEPCLCAFSIHVKVYIIKQSNNPIIIFIND